jgi:hypothetical protein
MSPFTLQVYELEGINLDNRASVIVVTTRGTPFVITKPGNTYVAANPHVFETFGVKHYRTIGEMQRDLSTR